MKTFKSNAVLGNKPTVKGGVVQKVAIAESGPTKDTRFITTKFIDDVVKFGNEQAQGVKARFGHPNMCSTTLGTYIGRYKNFTSEFRDGKKVAFADLHLDEIAKESPNGDLYSYVLGMAENNPDMFGNSVVVGVSSWQEIEINGAFYETLEIDGLIASDVVDDPAATNGLFANNEDLGQRITQFLDENEEIFSVIDREDLVEAFFNRYEEHLNKTKDSNKMNKFKKKIAEIFGKRSDFELSLTLADGAIIIIDTEGDAPIVGDSVTNEDGTPVADGEHILADGSSIVTSGGIITEVKESEETKEGEEGPTEESSEEEKSEENEAGSEEAAEGFSVRFEGRLQEQEQRFNKRIEGLNSTIQELQSTIEFMSKNIVSDFSIDERSHSEGSGKGSRTLTKTTK